MNQAPLKKSLGVLFLIVATELIGFGLIIPVLPQLALQFEANSLKLGVLMASYSFAQFLAAPLLGALSDRYGRKPILVLSKLGTMLSYFILASATNYLGFLVARLLDGFTGGNISVARAYVTDITTSENRSKGMAVIGIAFGVGFILGPAIGGFLYTPENGHVIASFLAAGLSFIAAIVTIFLLEEPKRNLESRSPMLSLVTGIKELKIPAVALICGIYLVYMCIFSGFETTFALYTFQLFGYDTNQNSFLFMYAGLLALVVQGTIARKQILALKKVTIFGFLFLVVAFLGMSNSYYLGVLLASMVFLALGIGFVNSFLPSLLSLYISKKNQGAVMGFYESIGSISRVIGPIVAYALVIDTPRIGYFGFAVVLLLTALVMFIYLKPVKDNN